MAKRQAVKRTVLGRVPIADDREVHVSRLSTAGEGFVEIREYIPSLKEYGRGIVVPDTGPVVLGLQRGLNKC